MRFGSRRLVLVAAIALPLAAAVGSFALTDDAPPPDVPAHVRVGGSAVPTSEPSRPTSSPRTTTTTTSSSKRPPLTAEVVPPPPPVEDGGGDDDDSDDGAGDDD